jgi:TolB-like protein/class 3 adenylate cyclase/cytochrome c-type biogenesis protein CcmH/NrfG
VGEQRVQRRLAAILAGDVAGYSRLTGLDEEGTIARLRALRRELTDPAIAEHGGRIVKTTGDGILIEFPSVVEAVRFAVEVQRGMATRNTDVAADRRIEFRVGIHLGDVVVEGDDLLGDGVNIAARLEGLAEPGGVCVSEDAYRHLGGKVDATLIDMGERQLKNIAKPVRVYGIAPPSRVHEATSELAQITTPPPRLSIVVLPFVNLGGDAEQDYFVDGLTEDLTTELSRLPGSFVVARNSAFSYEGKSLDVRQVGRELGVRYVLEGSVRKVAQRIRVAAQLIDAETGSHLWAERFDRELTDLFELQDTITLELAEVLNVRLVEAESRRSERSSNPVALDLVMRARAFVNRGASAEAYFAAIRLYQQALELAPDEVQALTGLATTLLNRVTNLWSETPKEDLDWAEELAARALALDPHNAWCRFAIGLVRHEQHQFEEAISHFEAAIRLNPNLHVAHLRLGGAKVFSGRAEEALRHFAETIRLSPRDPVSGYWGIGWTRFLRGDDDGAMEMLRRVIALNPNSSLGHLFLTAAYALQDRVDEARTTFAAYLRTGAPIKTISQLRARGSPSTNPVYVGQRERLFEGLRKAGMPEE